MARGVSDHGPTPAVIDARALRTRIGAVLNRWPVAGLAVGVVRDGSLAWFHGHGVSDADSGASVDEDTVFRIGSMTKTMTAVAVLQLVEAGRLDLDAPVAHYLRGYTLVPASRNFPPVTLRHLLTHTAGIPAVRRPTDLLRPALGWGVPAGRPRPSLPRYYRGGLRVDVAPGSKWAYSNHGFATLGQVVEDVTGIPLDRYLRERVFEPLGMEHSDLVRSERVRNRLATGYRLGAGGLTAVTDLEVVVAGAGGVYASTRDIARYAAALVSGGSNRSGSVLAPETVSAMFEPHYRPDPRVPGMGLGFFPDAMGGHRTVAHDGIWPGFLSALLLAPDDRTAVVVFSNTGRFEPRGAPAPVASAVLRALLGLPDDVPRTDVPERPHGWRELCGWYSLGPGPLTDPQPRAVFGAGVEVVVRHDHLTVRGQMPVPAIRRGLRLHPDADDPDVFHLDLTGLGIGTSRVVFGRGPRGEVNAVHLALQPMSFRRRPDAQNPRPWVTGALTAGAAALALRRVRRPR